MFLPVFRREKGGVCGSKAVRTGCESKPRQTIDARNLSEAERTIRIVQNGFFHEAWIEDPGVGSTGSGFYCIHQKSGSRRETMKKVCIVLIRVYQKVVSPGLPRMCRFHPSCSEYAIQSIDKYGLIFGLYRAGIRLLKCQPFHPGGYDPVP